jgi:hypothetical protein
MNKYRLSQGHTSELSKRLARKIQEDTGLICDFTSFRRTYAGYWQKSLGAFLWTMRIKGTPFEIGSCDTATYCLKKTNRLSLTDDRSEIVAERIKTEGKEI